MKQLILLLCIAFLATHHSTAQKKVELGKISKIATSTKKGKTNAERRKSTIQQNLTVVHIGKEDFYTVRLVGKPTSFYLDRYDKATSKLKKSIPLPDMSYQRNYFSGIEASRKEKSMEFLIEDTKGNLYLFYTDRDEKKKTNKLFRQLLNKKSLVIGKAELVATIPYKQNSRRGKFEFHQSPDKSKIVIMASEYGKKLDISKVYINVLDGNFNTLGEKIEDFPLTYFETGEIAFQRLGFPSMNPKTFVNNKGELFTWLKVPVKPKKYLNPLLSYNSKTYHVVYTIKLYKLSLKGDLKEYEFNLDDKYLYDMEMSLNSKGEIEGNGFYSDTRKLIKFKGLYHFTMNTETLSIIDDKTMPLQQEFSDKLIEPRALYTNEKDKWYNKKKLDDLNDIGYYIVKSLPQKDGSHIIIGEKRSSSDGSPDAKTGKYEYFYTNSFERIIILRLNPKGELSDLKYLDRGIGCSTTQKNLSKKERHGMACSVFPIQKGDDVYFVYMRHLKISILTIAKLSPENYH